MYLSSSCCNNLADDLASKNKSLTSSISAFVILSFPLTLASKFAGVSNCTAYLRVVLSPISANASIESSSIARPSV